MQNSYPTSILIIALIIYLFTPDFGTICKDTDELVKIAILCQENYF